MKKMRLVSTSFVIPSSILMLIRGDIKEIIKEITQIHVSSIELNILLAILILGFMKDNKMIMMKYFFEIST